jgi:hypothetical protein
MKKLIKSLPYIKAPGLLLALLLAPLFCLAQGPSEADQIFESHNKIYVVVLVLSTIFVGIILTLIYLERRIKKLEKSQQITKP